ncbi:MAG: type II toxin-antitoxin system RelE/ParE family toxin [Rickettsiales bacterium]
MIVEIFFHPSAISDINLARDWYVKENHVIGRSFIDALLRVTESLRIFPCSFAVCFSNIRRATVDGFP